MTQLTTRSLQDGDRIWYVLQDQPTDDRIEVAPEVQISNVAAFEHHAPISSGARSGPSRLKDYWINVDAEHTSLRSHHLSH